MESFPVQLRTIVKAHNTSGADFELNFPYPCVAMMRVYTDSTRTGDRELQGLRRWLLATADAHGLYERFGFKRLQEPERFTEINLPNPYESR